MRATLKHAIVALALVLGVVGMGPSARAQFGGGQPHVRVSVQPDRPAVEPGGVLVVAVVLDHAEHWHTYPSEAQADLLPEALTSAIDVTHTAITVDLPEGVSLRALQWPEPVSTETLDLSDFDGTMTVPLYTGRAVAFVTVVADPATEPGPRELMLTVSYQACDDTTCDMPTDEKLSIAFAVLDADGTAPTPTRDGLFAGYDEGFQTLPPQDDNAPPADGQGLPAPAGPSVLGIDVGSLGLLGLLLGAMLGGFVLNLTPCVLPVIPIKVLTLVQHAGEHRSRAVFLGAMMALGVIAFWTAVGLPMVLLKSRVDPSQLIFGTWWVTLGIGGLIALMGLGIMGLFVINLPQSVYMVNPKADNAWGSFLFGVMTAVLGLPCFGFVAGGLLLGAATMSVAQIMTVFFGLGLGMALPYFVLSVRPALVDRIPRTGPASELVKQVMGLLLMAAAAYFVAVGLYGLVAEQPWMAKNLKWWGATVFVSLAGLWLIVRTFQITRRAGPRVVFTALALASAGVTWWFADSQTTAAEAEWRLLAQVESDEYVTTTWNPFTLAKFDRAMADSKVIVVDFTAEWCINCKVYFATVLAKEPVNSRIRMDDVVAFEADTTSSRSEASAFMRELGITGIPALAVWGPGLSSGESPLMSNSALGPEVVRRINRAAGSAP